MAGRFVPRLLASSHLTVSWADTTAYPRSGGAGQSDINRRAHRARRAEEAVGAANL